MDIPKHPAPTITIFSFARTIVEELKEDHVLNNAMGLPDSLANDPRISDIYFYLAYHAEDSVADLLAKE